MEEILFEQGDCQLPSNPLEATLIHCHSSAQRYGCASQQVARTTVGVSTGAQKWVASELGTWTANSNDSSKIPNWQPNLLH